MKKIQTFLWAILMVIASCSPNKHEYIYGGPICLKKVENGNVMDYYIDSTAIGQSIEYYGSSNCPVCILGQMSSAAGESLTENRSMKVLYARGMDFENAIHVAKLRSRHFPVYIDSSGVFENASNVKVGAERLQIVTR